MTNLTEPHLRTAGWLELARLKAERDEARADVARLRFNAHINWEGPAMQGQFEEMREERDAALAEVERLKEHAVGQMDSFAGEMVEIQKQRDGLAAALCIIECSCTGALSLIAREALARYAPIDTSPERVAETAKRRHDAPEPKPEGGE